MCSFQIGWLTLKEEFDRMLGGGQTDKDRDNVFNELKSAVRDESMKKHRWDEKAEDSLVHLPLCILLHSFVMKEINLYVYILLYTDYDVVRQYFWSSTLFVHAHMSEIVSIDRGNIPAASLHFQNNCYHKPVCHSEAPCSSDSSCAQTVVIKHYVIIAHNHSRFF